MSKIPSICSLSLNHENLDILLKTGLLSFMYNSKIVFTAACVCMFTFGMSIICLGTILPEVVDKFQVSELAAGGLASILPLGVLIGSLFCGPLADRYGYKGLLIFCCALVMLGMEGLSFGNSWLIIQFSIFLIGTGGGALNSASSALVADISEGERGAKLSTLGIFYGLGALGMPLIISILADYFESFNIIAGAGTMVLIVIVGLLFIRFPVPKQQGGFPIKEGLQLAKNPVLILFGVIMFFQSGLEGLVSNWTNGFLQETLQIDSQKALMGLTVHMGALTLMRVALGFLLKRFSGVSILGFCYGTILVGCSILYFSNGYIWSLLSLILLGIGFAGIFPIVLGIIGDKWTTLSGTAFSVIFVIALLGNMLINYGMGIISFEASIIQFPVLLIVCAVAMGGLLWRARASLY